jgi:hypothetical protein
LDTKQNQLKKKATATTFIAPVCTAADNEVVQAASESLTASGLTKEFHRELGRHWNPVVLADSDSVVSSERMRTEIC